MTSSVPQLLAAFPEEALEEAMRDAVHNFLRLARTVDSSELDRNPFPEDHLMHGVWARATDEAEERLQRLNAEFMQTTPNEADWIAYYSARYDIYAKRTIIVVLTREFLPEWDQWLAAFADKTLAHIRTLSRTEEAVQSFSKALFGRREHWKAEARRYLRLQDAHRRKLASASERPVRRLDTEGGKPVGPPPTRAEEEVSVTNTQETNHRATVERFIRNCQDQISLKINRNHIWRAAGHKAPRQFEYWQASNPKATFQDDQNFRRILSMKPADFETLLKDKKII